MSLDSPSKTQEDRLRTLRFAVSSDVGRRREENQDSFGVVEGDSLKVFLVADGMGGARGGAIASGLAIELIKTSLRGQAQLTCSEISSVVKKANKVIAERGSLEPALAGMGTTLVGIAFSATNTFIFNVGDSRLYRLRSSSLEVCTEDHTLVQELINSGALAPEQAKNHPVSHMLTRSMGPTVDLQVDCEEILDGPYRDERFLLCSDGLYNQVSAEELEQHLRDLTIDEAVLRLIKLANERGGPDNITAMIVELGDGFPKEVRSTASKKRDSGVALGETGQEIRASGSQDENSDVVDRSDKKNFNEDQSAIPGAAELPPKGLATNYPLVLAVTFISLAVVLVFGFLSERLPTLVSTIALSDLTHESPVVDKFPSEQLEQNADLTPAVQANAVQANEKSIIGTEVSEVNTGTREISVIDSAESLSAASQNATSVIAQSSESVISVTSAASQESTLLLSTGSSVSSADFQDVLSSGEHALALRQKQIEEKILQLKTQVEFIQASESQRQERLKTLEAERLTLSEKIAAISQSLGDLKLKMSESERLNQSLAQGDSLALAQELAPKIETLRQLHENFEIATAAYLKALEDRKIDPENPAATENLNAQLRKRTEAFERLRATLTSEVQKFEQDLKDQKSQLARDLLLTQEEAKRNEQYRSVMAENMNEPNKRDTQVIALIQSLRDAERELQVLVGTAAIHSKSTSSQDQSYSSNP